MMTAATDYAKAEALLTRPLPAYVSYVQTGSARGIGNGSGAPSTVYVRTKDGAIVSGVGQSSIRTAHYSSNGGNPVTSPAFMPKCYQPVSESPARWDGNAATEIALRDVCGGDPEDNPFTTLYVDPNSGAPVAVDGTFSDSGVSVMLTQRYGRFGAYVFPTRIDANVRGRGMLFWVREYAQDTYAQYRFYDVLPKGVARQQASRVRR